MKFSKMFLMLMLTMVLILGTMGSAFAHGYPPPPPKYTLTVTSAGNGSVSGSGNYYKDTSVPVTATPDEGYYFVKWMLNIYGDYLPAYDIGDPANFNYIMTNKDAELTAYFAPIPHALSISVDQGMGSFSGTPEGDYGIGQSINISPIPDPGYHFVNWLKNTVDMGNTAISFSMPAEDVDVVLNFALNESYNVHGIIDPIGSGSIDGTGDYPFGMPVELTAIPEHGYYFDHWTYDPEEVSPSINGDMMTFDMPENDVDVTAVFKMLDMYGVTLIPMAADSGMPALDENAMPSEDYDGLYYIGDEFTITPNPIPHFHFVSYVIGEDEPITDVNHVFTMGEGDMEITVNYEEDYYVMATIQYLNASDVSIKPETVEKVYLGSYTFAPPAISGYTFGVSTPNASGTITEESSDFVVIHKYYVPAVVTNTVTNTVTETVFVNVPAPTEPTTEVLPTEPVPLGAATAVNFDSIYDNMEMPTTEAVMLPEEETPLADALPQTGQLPGELFYGIGGLVSAVGVFMKRKFNK